MFEINGKYTKATVYTDNIEEHAVAQILEVCNQEFTKDCKVAIMPDVHYGKDCTIGTSMEIKDKVVPGLVGLDIGCGIFCVRLKEKKIDFEILDETIRKYVPFGRELNDEYHSFASRIDMDKMICKKGFNEDKAKKGIGTLGGGNHFIEVNKDDEDNLYLVIHTGSRLFGKQVAEYYHKLAVKTMTDTRGIKTSLIEKLLREGRKLEINKELKKIKKPNIIEHLAYLEGDNLKDYLHDIDIVQRYSTENRHAIADIIISKMNLTVDEEFTTIHNYIDTEYKILRKGAISAKLNEKVIIPINMRDGSIIAIGKGNPDWNYSAPHGAGRLFSRRDAKEMLSLDEFKDTMEGIWSTSVSEATLDESPMAYKPIDEIINNVKDTIDIVSVIKPVYNFKAN